jgi:endonuclease I
VDNWERRRNDVIFRKFQGNRNPFIDHPEFVGLIW